MYISNRIGLFSWIATCLYFFTSTAPYNYLHHAMSDLGVTTSGEFTYEIAPYEICSPNHFWMNLLFILNGITFCVGVLYISQHLEKTRINKIKILFYFC